MTIVLIVPANYIGDVQDFEKSEEPIENGYYVNPNVQYQEDDILAVLGHSRAEGREDGLKISGSRTL